jgi:hypothetical protein
MGGNAMRTILPTRWNPPCTFVAFCLASLFALGCGGGKGTVKGKVIMGDKPITSGRVTFTVGTDQQSGQISPNGTYEVMGVPTGTATVTVVSPKPKVPYQGQEGADRDKAMPERPKDSKDHSKEMKQNTSKIQKAQETWREIPKEYENAEKTPLKFEVKKGFNEYDIPIKGGA